MVTPFFARPSKVIKLLMKRQRSEESSEEQPRVKKRARKDVMVLGLLQQAGVVDFLWEKVGELENTGNGCLKSSKLSLDPKGYPKNLRLMKKGVEKARLTDEMKTMHCFTTPEFQWSATGLALVKDGRLPPASNYEASHTCNHPWCLNDEHLLWEEPRMNYKRKNCLQLTDCPNCKHSFSPCIHNPPCIPCTLPNCKYH